jgi:hypothetical protein
VNDEYNNWMNYMWVGVDTPRALCYVGTVLSTKQTPFAATYIDN